LANAFEVVCVNEKSYEDKEVQIKQRYLPGRIETSKEVIGTNK